MAANLNPATVNEIKLGFNRSALTRSDEGLFPEGVSIPGFTSTQPDTYIIEKPSAYSIVDNLSWIRCHTIKAGGEIRRIHLNVGNGPATSVAFANLDAFLRNSLNSVSVGSRLDTVGVRRTFHSVYFQDEFKLNPTLTVNLGLRYEQYTVSHDVYGRGRVFDIVRCQGFCAPGTPWFFPDNDNIAPRISLAWSPKALGGKTVIRTGYGRYSQSRPERRCHRCHRLAAGKFFSNRRRRSQSQLSPGIVPQSAPLLGANSAQRSARPERARIPHVDRFHPTPASRSHGGPGRLRWQHRPQSAHEILRQHPRPRHAAAPAPHVRPD